MMKPYTKAQFVALNTYLAFWPEGLSYEQVLKQLERQAARESEPEADDIDARGDFEDLWPDHIALLIADLHTQLVNVYGEG
jgi:hypothetical protein